VTALAHMNAHSHQPGQAVRRVFMDCTATFALDANTGIQRVVRNIVNTAAVVGPKLGISCQGVVFKPMSGFVGIDRLQSPGAAVSPLEDRAASLSRIIRSNLKDWLLATNLLESARSIRQLAGRVKYLALRPARRRSRRAICCGRGDVLLLIDSSWDPAFPWDDVCEAQSRGALVGLVVYDLIPVQFPDVVGPRTHALYARWWDKARNVADFVIGISKSVLDDIEAVDRNRRALGAPLATLRSGYFKLGAELDGTVNGDKVRDVFAAAFADGAYPSNTYLMVGMISPRKNHALALDAFDRLWAEKADVRLAIAGRYGWDSGGLVERIRRHPQFGKKLFWFEDVRDHELDYCYRRAAGLITSSYAEGFNLPIVEALSKGCPVLASDLPVHREVGGAYAAYFPLGDAEALAAIIGKQRRQELHGVESPKGFHWPDWTHSCRTLLELVIELSSDSAARYDPDRRLTAAA